MAPRILTLANQKGGVGKTTTAINLATALAAIGERVLIVDLDPQGNASTGLGISRAGRDVSSYDLLMGDARVAEAAVMTSVPNVAIVPSTVSIQAANVVVLPLVHQARSLGRWSMIAWNPQRLLPVYARRFADGLLSFVRRNAPGRLHIRHAPPMPRPIEPVSEE